MKFGPFMGKDHWSTYDLSYYYDPERPSRHGYAWNFAERFDLLKLYVDVYDSPKLYTPTFNRFCDMAAQSHMRTKEAILYQLAALRKDPDYAEAFSKDGLSDKKAPVEEKLCLQRLMTLLQCYLDRTTAALHPKTFAALVVRRLMTSTGQLTDKGLAVITPLLEEVRPHLVEVTNTKGSPSNAICHDENRVPVLSGNKPFYMLANNELGEIGETIHKAQDSIYADIYLSPEAASKAAKEAVSETGAPCFVLRAVEYHVPAEAPIVSKKL